MRLFLFLLFTFCWSSHVLGQLKSEIPSNVSEELVELYRESKSVYKEMNGFFVGLYDIVDIKDVLIDLEVETKMLEQHLHSEANTKEVNQLAESIRYKINMLILVRKSFDGYNSNQELLSQEYFDLWNEVFQKKVYIDKLYTKVNITSTSYAGQNEQEFKDIRHKGIYYPCQMLYEHYLQMIRNTNQCDYVVRIDILKKAQQLLFKMEDMVAGDKTRVLEKEMKRLQNTEAVEQYLKI